MIILFAHHYFMNTFEKYNVHHILVTVFQKKMLLFQTWLICFFFFFFYGLEIWKRSSDAYAISMTFTPLSFYVFEDQNFKILILPLSWELFYNPINFYISYNAGMTMTEEKNRGFFFFFFLKYYYYFKRKKHRLRL